MPLLQMQSFNNTLLYTNVLLYTLYRYCKCSAKALDLAAMHWIHDLVALTQILRWGGFIQEMQGGNCELQYAN